MYLLNLYIVNGKQSSQRFFRLREFGGKIRKWSLLPSSPSNRELLRLAALACAGPGVLPHLNGKPGEFAGDRATPLSLEFTVAVHPLDVRGHRPDRIGSGFEVDGRGAAQSITKKEVRFLPLHSFRRTLPGLRENTPFFFLAYGSSPGPVNKEEAFDFPDPHFRVNRFRTLFKDAPLTHPVLFLQRIHHKGVGLSRFPSAYSLERISFLLRRHLGIETSQWMKKGCDFKKEWRLLAPWKKRMVLPLLDGVRHFIDGFPTQGRPLEAPTLILLDRPDAFCTVKWLPHWIKLVDELFTTAQILVTLSPKNQSLIPRSILKKRLSLPEKQEEGVKRKRIRIPAGAVLLIHVDGRLPNLALMKLSRYYKSKGRRIVLLRREESFVRGAEEVYGSAVFFSESTRRRVEKLREYYGTSLEMGGSGVDLNKRLPEEIDTLPPDYTLYPELEDRALGFLTRGCPLKCPFCIVPKKEGKVRLADGLETLLQGRKKLILLDDNILSHPQAEELLEEMASRDLLVNFTQTLDIRRLNREKARLLRRVRSFNTRFTRENYYFSLNDARGLNLLRRNYELLGFKPGDNVEFVCMYGFNTTLEQDVDRFRFLRSLPGAYVFVQEYQPIQGGPAPNLAGFFNAAADRLIDELVRIYFKQNMKSMEKYYFWLSRRYVQTFGKLHSNLVDTIFRYNKRHKKGEYIATLAGTVPLS